MSKTWTWSLLLVVAPALGCSAAEQSGEESLGSEQQSLAVGVPSRIQAEDYVRFNETTPTSNSGGQCDRADGVDKQLTLDPNGGNCNVGWTAAGEWLEYDINAASDGVFGITLRVASNVANRTLHATLDGVSLGSVTAPASGWQSWQDRTYANVHLSPGNHVLRVTFDSGDVNFNYLDVTQAAASCVSQPLARTLAIASSVENATFPAVSAIDASTTTRWSSQFSDPQWIYVDLGAPRHVSSVRLNWEAAASANYDIQVSGSAAGPWTNVFTTAAGNGGIDDIGGLSATARFVRMFSRARTTAFGNSLFDFAVMGDPNPNCSGSGADSDGDRLLDSVETNTGVFVGPGNTGTSPTNPDTDADGLPDGDEVLGTTLGLNLPAMGTNPLRKNILLEYDWFNDALDCGAHSHRPNAALVDRVSVAFANAPVSNPNGTQGITLIHDFGQGGVFSGGNLINDADGIVDGLGSEYFAYKGSNFAANRNGYFHYVIMPHQYTDRSNFSSGLAFFNGSDMIVSLQCSNTNEFVGNTIMHELGHNLSLDHGGNEGTNFKPNYNSVMNYAYQFSGVDNNCTPPGDGVLDYSRNQRITLDESSLNESNGICNGVDWDWNFSGTIESNVSFDVNSDSFFSTLADYDDWAHLFYDFSPGLGAGSPSSLATRIAHCDNPAPKP